MKNKSVCLVLSALLAAFTSNGLLVSRYVQFLNHDNQQQGLDLNDPNILILNNLTVTVTSECILKCMSTDICTSVQTYQDEEGIRCLLFQRIIYDSGQYVPQTGSLVGKNFQYFGTVFPENSIIPLGCASFCFPDYPMQAVGDLINQYDENNLNNMIMMCAAHTQSRGLKTFGLTYTAYCFVGDESVKENYMPCGPSTQCEHDSYGLDDNIFVFALA